MTEESTEQEARVCGTCGSDDPTRCNKGWLNHRHGIFGDSSAGAKCCPDPFHEPAPPENEVGEAVERVRQNLRAMADEQSVTTISGTERKDVLLRAASLLADHTRLSNRLQWTENERCDLGEELASADEKLARAEQEAQRLREALERAYRLLSNTDVRMTERSNRHWVNEALDVLAVALKPPTEQEGTAAREPASTDQEER